jgi:hypothetical protein
MRPLLAFLVVGSILGGLQLYMTYRPQPRREPLQAEVTAAGRFDVELTLTFDAGPDAFALDPTSAAALLVQLRGHDVLRRTDRIAAGTHVVVKSVAGIVVGANEFYVQATPQDTTSPVARALRVRVLRNGNPLSQQTLWSEPGDVIQGAIVVEVPAWSGAPDRESTTTPADDSVVEESARV